MSAQGKIVERFDGELGVTKLDPAVPQRAGLPPATGSTPAI
jgi:hypothetical protein